MNNVNTPAPKVKLYGLVRVDGKPIVQNPLTVPDQVWDGLSQEDKDYINSQVDDSLKRLN